MAPSLFGSIKCSTWVRCLATSSRLGAVGPSLCAGCDGRLVAAEGLSPRCFGVLYGQGHLRAPSARSSNGSCSRRSAGPQWPRMPFLQETLRRWRSIGDAPCQAVESRGRNNKPKHRTSCHDCNQRIGTQEVDQLYELSGIPHAFDHGFLSDDVTPEAIQRSMLITRNLMHTRCALKQVSVHWSPTIVELFPSIRARTAGSYPARAPRRCESQYC